jgi:hypothetical protein
MEVMVMDKSYLESQGEFSFSFEGKNSINAETFSKTITAVIEAIQIVTANEEPDAFFKLEISSFRPGSFTMDLIAVMGVIPSLLNEQNLDTAQKVVTIFLGVLGIKKFLKGKPPKQIKHDKGMAVITNERGENSSVPASAANLYFQNAKIDKAIINIISAVKEDPERDSFEVYSKGTEKVKIAKGEFDDMSETIVVDDNVKNVWKNEICTNLLIRQPDFMGNAKWGFYFNRYIQVTIADLGWLNKVRTGKIKIYAGVRIPVKLVIEVDIGKDNLPIKDSERYSILEVTGDIIEPEDNQISL